jgi:hypothetical protein
VNDADDRPIGFVPIFKAPKGAITTHAFILCAGCNAAISGTGGPRTNAYCRKCVREELKDDQP